MKSALGLRAAALAVAVGLSLCGCTSGDPPDGPAAASARAGESRANAARNADLTFSEPKFKSVAPTTVVGDTITGKVEVTNDSDTDVVVGEVNFLSTDGANADGAGAFSVVGDSCQGSIPAHGSCTISVDYAPTEVGTASTVLRLYVPKNNSYLDIPITRTAMAAATGPSRPPSPEITRTPRIEQAPSPLPAK